MSAETFAAWSSTAVSNYPESIIIGENPIILINGREQRSMIGVNLIAEGLIPPQGKILELGSASCTHLIFPLDHERVTATDFSQILLEKNPLPWGRKYILDAGNTKYPEEWTGSFSLVAGILLSRYLTQKEALFLARQSYRCLEDKGYLLLADISQISLQHPQMSRTLAEQRPFELDIELEILSSTGFRNLSHGVLNLIFLNNEGSSDMYGYKLNWVRGQKNWNN